MIVILSESIPAFVARVTSDLPKPAVKDKAAATCREQVGSYVHKIELSSSFNATMARVEAMKLQNRYLQGKAEVRDRKIAIQNAAHDDEVDEGRDAVSSQGIAKLEYSSKATQDAAEEKWAME